MRIWTSSRLRNPKMLESLKPPAKTFASTSKAKSSIFGGATPEPKAANASKAPKKEKHTGVSITVKQANGGYVVDYYHLGGDIPSEPSKPHIAKTLAEADDIIDKALEECFGEEVDTESPASEGDENEGEEPENEGEEK